MRPIWLLICLLATTGCDENGPTGPSVPLNARFTLAPGAVALVEPADLRVQFLRVSGDSRCPADAICIQGGDALVHVRVLDDRSPVDYELHTGDTSRGSAVHRGVRLTLVELQPYPFSSRPIAGDEYRATLVVSRP